MSKYDQFWENHVNKLVELITTAATGGPAEMEIPEIRSLGHRASWTGSAKVQGSRLVDAPMAHASSLGKMVAKLNLCSSWPDLIFTFTITSSCRLRVSTANAFKLDASSTTQPTRSISQSTSQPVSVQPSIIPTLACAEIHRQLARLPEHDSPSKVGFRDCLYFFYETGEQSSHALDGRIVRIGNHPRSESGLVQRLQNHFRSSFGAKNGSVFRRYIGGTLMRRDNPNLPCLAPASGHGHWEKQDESTCDQCTPYEQEVTRHIQEQMEFRCVQITDKAERNSFEKLLVATIAQCSVCQPSGGWLGRSAYSVDVQETGLWNSDYVHGTTVGQGDLARFTQLVATTPDFRSHRDLSDTLLVIPCCGEKRGTRDPGLPLKRIADYLSPATFTLLEQGRNLAFSNPKTSLEEHSQLKPAVSWYTGQPYCTEGFRELLADALRDGLHCLIISGGYGLLRPEEPIHNYKAHLSKTISVWQNRLPVVLKEYVSRNGIRRSFGSFSESHYARVVPDQLAKENFRAIPSFDRRFDHGAPLRVVPARVGELLLSLLRADFSPTEGWEAV